MGDDADPIDQASGVCFLVGGLGVLVGAVAIALGWSAIGLGALVEGAIYIGLGVGIRNESAPCGWAAACLYTATTCWLLTRGMAPVALGLRALFCWRLWSAISRMADLRAADALAAARRAALPAQPAPMAMAYAPTLHEPPPPEAPARRTTRLARRGSQPARACLTCRREYPLKTLRCPPCGVQLFDV